MVDQPLTPGRCNGLNAAGAPCAQDVGAAAVWCLWHDPNRVEEAAALRALGLERSHETARERAARRVHPEDPPPVLEATPEGILLYQGWIIQATATGRLDPKQTTALNSALVGLRKDVDADALRQNLKAAERTIADLRKKLERLGAR